MVRSQCCDKLNARKGAWVEEKDGTTFAYLSKHGTTNWTSAPRKTGTKRCGKNCRSRWNSYLRPDLSQEGFTQQEEELIIKLHAAVGSRWGLIAHQLPGRTENDIKNHWNTKLRKKLSEMGIDPITHKPFSQILADYGNIGGVSRSSDAPKYIGTIRRDLKKASTSTPPKPESCTSPPYVTTFLSNSQVSHNISSLAMQDNYATSSSNNNSLDLLSQLQAISIVTEGLNTSINVTSNNSYEYSSLPSPKSPITCLTAAAVSSSYNNAGQASKSPDCFSWHDFLLDEEAFKPAQNQAQQQEENTLTEILSSNNDNGGIDYNKSSQAAALPMLASSDASSFLEAMLDQENDMFLSFPGLMEEPSY